MFRRQLKLSPDELAQVIATMTRQAQEGLGTSGTAIYLVREPYYTMKLSGDDRGWLAVTYKHNSEDVLSGRFREAMHALGYCVNIKGRTDHVHAGQR